MKLIFSMTSETLTSSICFINQLKFCLMVEKLPSTPITGGNSGTEACANEVQLIYPIFDRSKLNAIWYCMVTAQRCTYNTQGNFCPFGRFAPHRILPEPPKTYGVNR